MCHCCMSAKTEAYAHLNLRPGPCPPEPDVVRALKHTLSYAFPGSTRSPQRTGTSGSSTGTKHGACGRASLPSVSSQVMKVMVSSYSLVVPVRLRV